jgi:hypothetical protein
MAETPAGFAPDPPPGTPRRKTAADWRGGGGTSKGKLIAITLVLLLAVGGIIAGLIFWPKTAAEPRFIAMPIDQYGPLWPVAPWAGRDAKILGDPFGDRASYAFNYQQADKFHLWLDWLAAKSGAATDLPTDFELRPLIIHLTALAAAKADGVYVLLPRPQEATFAQSVEWLKLDTLLEAVAACPAMHKLLLLDLAHPVADPFNGILDDSVSTALDELLASRQKVGKLPCPVLTACGPGQTSLSCDPERCSLFAFYVMDGLRGAADGAISAGERDDVITVAELARYTAARVDRWARICCGQRQTPLLYLTNDTTADFPVAYKQNLPDDRYEPPSPQAYPTALSKAWQQRGAARSIEFPVAHARWTAGLLRAEQLFARSGDSDRAENAWVTTHGVWVEETRSSGPAGTLADAQTAVVAPAARFRLPAESAAKPESLAELGKLLDAFLQAKPEEEAKAKSPWVAKANELPLDAARLVWQRALGTERPERKEIRRWVEALAGVKLPRAYAELLLLERLAGYDFVQENGLSRAPGDAIAALLMAEAAVGRVAAAAPSGFAVLDANFAQADANRRDAERALFAAKSLAEASAAGTKLIAAAAEFDRVRKRLENRQAARMLAEAARITLLETMSGAIRNNRPDFDQWKKTAESLTALLDKLDAAERNAASDGSEWVEQTTALPALVKELRERLDSAAALKFLRESPPRTNAAEVAKLAEMLEGPALSGEARGAVWTAWLTDLTALHRSVRQQDKADDEAKGPSLAPAQAAATPANEIALRRAEASVLLLALAGASGESETALKSAKADPANAATWDRLGTALRIDWLSKLPARTREDLAAGKLGAAERILRTTPAELAKYLDRSASDARPWLDRSKADAAAQRRCVLKQLADDAPLRARGEAAMRFYDEVRTESNQP